MEMETGKKGVDKPNKQKPVKLERPKRSCTTQEYHHADEICITNASSTVEDGTSQIIHKPREGCGISHPIMTS